MGLVGSWGRTLAQLLAEEALVEEVRPDEEVVTGRWGAGR